MLFEKDQEYKIYLKKKNLIVSFKKGEGNDLIFSLKNGMFFAINKKKILKIEKISQERPLKRKKELKSVPFKRELIVISFGGTISSKQTEGGGVDSQKNIFFEDYSLMNFFKIRVYNYQFINILSENLNFEHISSFLEFLKKLFFKHTETCGFLLLHGTDTLAYTASFLSFAVRLPIPICIIGAQKSTDRPSTDGYLNYYAGIKFIATTNSRGVFAIFHESISSNKFSIIPGASLKKIHTSARNAFISTANTSYKCRLNQSFPSINLFPKNEKSKEHFFKKISNKFIVLYETPFSNFLEFREAIKKVECIIIVGSGMGHVKEDTIKSLQKIKKKIVITSNCIFGQLFPAVYSTGRKLGKMKVIFSKLPTLESTIAKVSVALANHSDIFEEYVNDVDVCSEFKKEIDQIILKK